MYYLTAAFVHCVFAVIGQHGGHGRVHDEADTATRGRRDRGRARAGRLCRRGGRCDAQAQRHPEVLLPRGELLVKSREKPRQ